MLCSIVHIQIRSVFELEAYYLEPLGKGTHDNASLEINLELMKWKPLYLSSAFKPPERTAAWRTGSDSWPGNTSRYLLIKSIGCGQKLGVEVYMHRPSEFNVLPLISTMSCCVL